MKKILMTEDDKEICEVTRRYFSGKGTEITCIYGADDTIDRMLEILDEYEAEISFIRAARSCRRI